MISTLVRASIVPAALAAFVSGCAADPPGAGDSSSDGVDQTEALSGSSAAGGGLPQCGFLTYDFISRPVGSSCRTETQSFKKIQVNGFDIGFVDSKGTVLAMNLATPNGHALQLPFLDAVSFCDSRGMRLVPIGELLAYAQRSKFPTIFKHRKGGLGLDIWSASGDAHDAYTLHLAGEPTIGGYPSGDNSTSVLCFSKPAR